MRWPDRRPSARRAPIRPGVVAALVLLAVLPSCGLFSNDTDVLLIGDSIMNQSGDFVDRSLEDLDGIADVSVLKKGENGTGLLTPRLFNWVAATERLVDRHDPEIVVILFVGNYTDDDYYIDEDGVAIDDYTPAFFEAWYVEAMRLTGVAQSGGAEVFWVQPPPLPTAEGQRRADELRAVYERVAEDAQVGIVDGGAALSDADGEFAWELPDAQGRMHTVRAPDGLHLEPVGGQLLAAAIADAIAPTLRIRLEDGS